MKSIFDYIEQHQQLYVERLAAAVSIESVSAWPSHRGRVLQMMQWGADFLKRLGADVDLVEIGEQKLADGSAISLPPLIWAQLGNNPQKKTVCIYGHLDVQPAALSDGWDTEPFALTVRDGRLYGRGSSDDKGPVIAWLNAIEAMQAVAQSTTAATSPSDLSALPVNVKFVLEGMEEYGSEGLEETLHKRRHFFDDVDYVCISDNRWLGKNKPCISYGVRGIAYFFVEVECAKCDLHSGVFGGTIHEAMTDLVHLLSSLVDSRGNILIPGICDSVVPLTEAERQLYTNIDFDCEEYGQDMGIDTKNLAYGEDKVETLLHRWRYPCLSIHGVEGAFAGEGCKTVIPRRVVGKFSIRLVPNQQPDEICRLVEKHLHGFHAQSASPNRLIVRVAHAAKAWMGDFNHPHYQAGINACKTVWNQQPDMTRQGGSIPVTLMFEQVTGKNVMLLPIGACDDNSHAQNEKLNLSNYINGTKLMAAYLCEVAKLQ